jgi:hypothetical protein
VTTYLKENYDPKYKLIQHNKLTTLFQCAGFEEDQGMYKLIQHNKLTTLFQCAGFEEDQGISIINALGLSMPQ